MYFSVKSVCWYDAPPAVALLAFSPSEHLEENIIKNHQESQQRIRFGKIPWQTVGDRVRHTEHKSRRGRKRDALMTSFMRTGENVDKLVYILLMCLQSLSCSLPQMCHLSCHVSHYLRYNKTANTVYLQSCLNPLSLHTDWPRVIQM